METTTEASDKLLVENITERVETTESHQSISIEGKVVEESRTVTYETTQEIVTTLDQPVENNSFFQPVTEGSSISEENKINNDNVVENAISDSTEVANSMDVIENDPTVNLEAQTDFEMTQVETEKFISEATAPVEGAVLEEKSEANEAPEQTGQSEDYNSEYLLEHQSANVYMPEQQEEARLVSEQEYATELISDDSQDNNVTFEHGIEQENSTVEEANVTTETVDTVQESGELVDSNADKQIEDTNESSNKEEEPVKADTAETPPEEPVAVDESRTENQIVDEKLDNENVTTEENVEQEVQQIVEEDVQQIVEGDVQGVKEESAPMQVNDKQQDDSYTVDTQVVSENVHEMETDQQMEIQHEANANSELVDSIELTNVSTSSENVTLETYTLSDGLEVTEVQEGEYTIVEGPGSLELSATHQIQEGNSDGSLVLVQNYESSENFEQSEEGTLMQLSDDQQLYMAELRGEASSRQSTSSVGSDVKPRRGRKPTFEIPMHVLGHNISKPLENIPNGRALPKPRLGVKVPYRNLTSQIVTKAEIEKEIMERARLKQEQAMAKGDVLFARKLTQRLARKIAPSPNHPQKRVTTWTKPKDQETELKDSEVTDPLALEASEVNTAQNQQQKINNDSDLLAILEGEGDDMPVLPKEVPQPVVDDTDVKMLEREIALQQLQELPYQEPKQRTFRGRQHKTETKAPLLTAEASSKSKTTEKTGSAAKQTSSSTAQSAKKSDAPSQAVSDKENTSKHVKETTTSSPKKDHTKIDLPSSPKKSNIEMEPQVKVNMVLKTYSRKRKTVELPEPFPETPVAKKPMLNDSDLKTEKSESTTDVYVTKSSRVIKKKVIWDPDEIPVRSPKAPKQDSPTKAVKPAEKESRSEKPVEKKPPSEKVVKEKLPEKKATDKPVVKKTVNEKSTPPSEKKTPKTENLKNSKTPVKNKKSLSEVDRLLMDEGAVKMLYDLKNNDESTSKKKKDVYSVERAQKEIIKKANEIKNDLQQNTSNESPKSLRKKEAMQTPPFKPALIVGIGERKMSKDSTRSSLHTPPGSPAYSQSSMLVRRRSSSSISSSDEVSTDENARTTRKKSASDVSKPKKKIKKTEEPQEPLAPKEPSQPKAATTPPESKLTQFKSFTVKKSNKHITIDLNYGNDKCYCTAKVLEELTVALKKYAKDKDCNVVSITSSGKAFCLGLDYGALVFDKEDVRKKHATELSVRVRDFLLCLLNFPKVLVAGIQGECVGLGVTMLPLFDMVIASDTATFSTQYASLGCIAEAGFLLSSPHLTNHGLAAELLFTSQKLTADDVFRRGLISRLCWPEKYNETLKNLLTSISKGSRQSLEATKSQLRQHLVQTTEAAINSESKLLVEHWTSAECQKSFAQLGEPASN